MATVADYAIAYSPYPDTLWLLTDGANNIWVDTQLGSGSTLENSQCRVSTVGASVRLTGPTLTLTLPVTFTPAYSGADQIAIGRELDGRHHRLAQEGTGR